MKSFGAVGITFGANQKLKALGLDSLGFTMRHFSGDWGKICKEDAEQNNASLATKGMLMSVYDLPDGTDLWVITDPGHEVTTVLLPEEY